MISTNSARRSFSYCFYFQLLSSILKPSDETSNRNLKLKVESLKHILLLRSEFGFDVSLSCLGSVVTIDSLLKSGIFQIMGELKVEPKEETGIGFVWRKMQILTQCLQQDFLSGVHQFCSYLENLHFTCGIVDVLLQSMDLEDNFNCKAWLDLSVLIFAQQIKYFEDDNELDEFYDPLAFPLIHKVAVSCLPFANYLQFDEVVEIIRWAEIGKEFYDLNIIESTRPKRLITKEVSESLMKNQ